MKKKLKIIIIKKIIMMKKNKIYKIFDHFNARIMIVEFIIF